MNLYTAAITLFLVMNPLGNLPVFISTLQHIEPQRRARIIMREAFFAFIILTFFLFAGRYILAGLQISPSALGISGGMVLFLIAIRLIFPQQRIEKNQNFSEEPFLVPLAIPLFAGPATMAMIMLLANQQHGSVWLTFLALLIAWGIASLVLLAGSALSNFLGKRGLIAIERLMGMLLITIAIQMLLTGIEHYFKILR